MNIYADWTFYVGTYKGTSIVQASFDSLAMRASAVIDQITFDTAQAVYDAATETDNIEMIKLATCAVAEAMQVDDASAGKIVTSESIGNLSVSYAVDSKQTDTARFLQAARIWLDRTGLLYRGFE